VRGDDVRGPKADSRLLDNLVDRPAGGSPAAIAWITSRRPKLAARTVSPVGLANPANRISAAGVPSIGTAAGAQLWSNASPSAAMVYQHATEDRDRLIADRLTAMAAEAGVASVVPLPDRQPARADG
jgi:hypothetical protein